MPARIRMMWQGEVYLSAVEEKHTAATMRDTIYENFERMEKITFLLLDGSLLVCGETVLKECVLIFEDIPE